MELAHLIGFADVGRPARWKADNLESTCTCFAVRRSPDDPFADVGDMASLFSTMMWGDPIVQRDREEHESSRDATTRRGSPAPCTRARKARGTGTSTRDLAGGATGRRRARGLAERRALAAARVAQAAGAWGPRRSRAAARAGAAVGAAPAGPGAPVRPSREAAPRPRPPAPRGRRPHWRARRPPAPAPRRWRPCPFPRTPRRPPRPRRCAAGRRGTRRTASRAR